MVGSEAVRGVEGVAVEREGDLVGAGEVVATEAGEGGGGGGRDGGGPAAKSKRSFSAFYTKHPDMHSTCEHGMFFQGRNVTHL